MIFIAVVLLSFGFIFGMENKKRPPMLDIERINNAQKDNEEANNKRKRDIDAALKLAETALGYRRVLPNN